MLILKKSFAQGNSILIHVANDRYVFVGDSVYSFRSHEPIKQYHSPIGNNDVPYPVAESKSSYFFMLDHVWMSKEGFVITSEAPDDLYYHFYGHGGVKQVPTRKGEFQDVQILHARVY